MGELLQTNNSMRNAVSSLIECIRGEIVQHQHGSAALGQYVLQGEKMAAISQRTLREQPELRETIEND